MLKEGDDTLSVGARALGASEVGHTAGLRSNTKDNTPGVFATVHGGPAADMGAEQLSAASSRRNG